MKELEFSVFDAETRTIVNTVNTRGVMGAGLALEFRLRFPAMYADYELRCRRGNVVAGEPYLYESETDQWILNFPTKQDWRKPSKLEWIRKGIERVRQMSHDGLLTGSIAFPRLGASHGGLDWPTVRDVMVNGLEGCPIEVILCEDRRPRPGGEEARMLAYVNDVAGS